MRAVPSAAPPLELMRERLTFIDGSERGIEVLRVRAGLPDPPSNADILNQRPWRVDDDELGHEPGDRGPRIP
jgi:hypothetical protein